MIRKNDGVTITAVERKYTPEFPNTVDSLYKSCR